MTKKVTDCSEICELLTRVLCDTPPDKSDGVFLSSQTANNQKSVFATAHRLLEDGLAPRVLFMNTPPVSGYPGYDLWGKDLKARGVPEEKLEPVPLRDTSSLNTLIESQALINFAKLRGYKVLLITSAPFHQLRAFMTAVTVASQEYPDLHLYSKPGEPLPWEDRASHSQGTLSETRSKLVWSEMERIGKYGKKGDLGSFNLVLEYLERRDRS